MQSAKYEDIDVSYRDPDRMSIVFASIDVISA